jgi:hypothetical protein
MKFMLNKQTGVFILREDIFDRISRQAKAEVGSEIASENAAASDRAAAFLKSIDRVRDNYIKQLYEKKETDKPSYLTIIPLLVDKDTSNNLINEIKKSIDKVNAECTPFFTDIRDRKQVDYNKLINALQINLKGTVARLVLEATSGPPLQTEVIFQSIIKNYIAFLINETLLKDLSDEDKKNVFRDEENFKKFQQIFSKMLMATDEENKVYQTSLEKYNIAKDKLKTKSPEEAREEEDTKRAEKKEQDEIRLYLTKKNKELARFVRLYGILSRTEGIGDQDKHQQVIEHYNSYIDEFSDLIDSNEKLDKEGSKDRMELILNSIDMKFGSLKDEIKKLKAVKESKILKEYREEINNLLIPHMQKQLGFNHPPTINFADDQGNAQDMFGKTAYYNPSTSEITVYVTNRHPKDIMRSVAHEIVHHAQNQRGEFENSFNLGEEGYAQNNSHLRSMEEEAYLSGNMIFRDWEDQFKKQRNQKTMVNENNLRAKIRSMIAEEIANQTENKPAKEHDSECECEDCSKKRTFLKNKGVKNIAEKIEKEIMPLKEWRNMELNSLLLHRFGLVSPQVLGEKKNKKPDADGDGVPDWADKEPNDSKVGAKGKKPTKKGKVPPQFLKGKKKDESK